MLSLRPADRHAEQLRRAVRALCATCSRPIRSRGSLFLFVNRRGDRLKAMWWDRDGLALFYKRLESGTFEVLRPEGEAATIEIDAAQLAMLLSGVPLRTPRRLRYSRAS